MRSELVEAGRSAEHRQVELLLAGDLAELVLGARLDLSDPLLGDPEFPAELFEGLLAGPLEAEPADDDLPLAVVEPPLPSETVTLAS